MKRSPLNFFASERDQEVNGRNLRLVDATAEIIEWPVRTSEPRPEHARAVTITAEVQAKRFKDRTVDSDRYTATLKAKDGSPYSIMAALVEACEEIPELRSLNPGDENIILQINLRTVPA